MRELGEFNGVKLTGWMHTDATNLVSCPRCSQVAAAYCRTPKGRLAKYPHTERMIEFNKLDIPVSTYQGSLIRGDDYTLFLGDIGK